MLVAHSDWILTALMFFVGISVGGSKGLVGKVKEYHVRVLIIPAGIIVGSIAGGLVAAFLCGLSLPTGAAIASGLGWYSLSGVMLTGIAGAQIGSITFLSNLLRELISVFHHSLDCEASELSYLHRAGGGHERRHHTSHDDSLHQRRNRGSFGGQRRDLLRLSFPCL